MMDNEMNSAIGITDILIDAINKKYDNVRDLNSLNVNLTEEDYEEIIPVIDSIIEDDNNSIGKLQQLIDLLSSSGSDIEEGKQETIDIIDNNEFVESITLMKNKLRLDENFDNVIDDVQAVASPTFVGANEEHDENKKKYEAAMEENKEAAEDTIPSEGDTGKEVKSKALKSMHLSEELFDEGLSPDFIQYCGDNISEYILTEFTDLKNSEIREVLRYVMSHFSGSDFEESLKEDLSFNDYSDFNSAVYNAVSDVCFKFSEKGLSKKDIEAAIEWFQTHFFENEDLNFIEDDLDESLLEGWQTEDDSDMSIHIYDNIRNGKPCIVENQTLSIAEPSSVLDIDKYTFSAYDKNSYKKLYMAEFDTFGEAMAAANAYIDAHCNKINESFVQEWWGQTDKLPTNFAKNYNLKILPLRKNADEVLYRFEGSIDDFENAINDGYFYSLTCQKDDAHSEDIDNILHESLQVGIAKQQIKRFTEGKMPKNWNVDTYLNNLVEKKHINKKEAKSLREWYSHTK